MPGKAGLKNKFNRIQNIELQKVMDGYYDILEECDVINLKSGAHQPKECLEYTKDKRVELLANPAFADLSDEDMATAEKVHPSYSLSSFILLRLS